MFLVDSQAGPAHPFHYINCLDAFVPGSLRPMATPLHVTGVGEGGHDGTTIGTVEVIHPESGRTLRIDDCVYLPSFPASVLNPVHLERRGTEFFFKERKLVTSDGTTIALDPDWLRFSAHVPSSRATAAVPQRVLAFETVQRGAHGKLHIDASAMRGVQRAEFELQLARLNDPPM